MVTVLGTTERFVFQFIVIVKEKVRRFVARLTLVYLHLDADNACAMGKWLDYHD